jgi:hypothetical protein
MTQSPSARRPQIWEAKWVFVGSMNQHRDSRPHLCVAIASDGDAVTLLPTSTKPVTGRPNQRPVRWGGAEVYPATNRVFTVPIEEWLVLRPAEVRHQPDREIRGFLKQELHRA